MNKAELKVFYKDALLNTVISETGNAGIGLLDIVYRSGKNVNYSFNEYKKGRSYFELKVSIQEV